MPELSKTGLKFVGMDEVRACTRRRTGDPSVLFVCNPALDVLSNDKTLCQSRYRREMGALVTSDTVVATPLCLGRRGSAWRSSSSTSRSIPSI